MDWGSFFFIGLICFVLFTFFAVFGGDEHFNFDTGDTAVSDVFTLRNLLLFGIGFGACGALMRYMGFGQLLSGASGLIVGVVMVAISVAIYYSVKNQQSNSVVSLETLTGKTAVVTTPIPENGTGEITVNNDHGTPTPIAAQAQQGAIRENTPVTIVRMAGGRAIVTPIV